MASGQDRSEGQGRQGQDTEGTRPPIATWKVEYCRELITGYSVPAMEGFIRVVAQDDHIYTIPVNRIVWVREKTEDSPHG